MEITQPTNMHMPCIEPELKFLIGLTFFCLKIDNT